MFDWDAANIAPIAEHGTTPAEAEQLLLNNPFDLGPQIRNGEERFANLGETDEGRILRIIATWRGNLIRVVTPHPANRMTREFYRQLKEAEDDELPGDA